MVRRKTQYWFFRIVLCDIPIDISLCPVKCNDLCRTSALFRLSVFYAFLLPKMVILAVQRFKRREEGINFIV